MQVPGRGCRVNIVGKGCHWLHGKLWKRGPSWALKVTFLSLFQPCVQSYETVLDFSLSLLFLCVFHTEFSLIFLRISTNKGHWCKYKMQGVNEKFDVMRLNVIDWIPGMKRCSLTIRAGGATLKSNNCNQTAQIIADQSLTSLRWRLLCRTALRNQARGFVTMNFSVRVQPHHLSVIKCQFLTTSLQNFHFFTPSDPFRYSLLYLGSFPCCMTQLSLSF